MVIFRSEEEAVRLLESGAPPAGLNPEVVRNNLELAKSQGYDPRQVYDQAQERRPAWFRPLPPYEEVGPED